MHSGIKWCPRIYCPRGFTSESLSRKWWTQPACRKQRKGERPLVDLPRYQMLRPPRPEAGSAPTRIDGFRRLLSPRVVNVVGHPPTTRGHERTEEGRHIVACPWHVGSRRREDEHIVLSAGIDGFRQAPSLLLVPEDILSSGLLSGRAAASNGARGYIVLGALIRTN